VPSLAGLDLRAFVPGTYMPGFPVPPLRGLTIVRSTRVFFLHLASSADTHSRRDGACRVLFAAYLVMAHAETGQAPSLLQGGCGQ
jgi:hypothetical protein